MKVICLTPVKNEAWILHRFLQCTSVWADYIIIADQGSTDGSREIAQSYSQVILVDNPSTAFNEPERQKILLEAARKIPAPRLLITLDADEVLTANFRDSPEWKTVLQAPVGTVIKFQWANIRPDLQSYWAAAHFPWGFMDDGSHHRGERIHSPRIPLSEAAPTIILGDIKVLHYQYADWERMKSKHRWYQCWERLNQPSRRAVDIYRQYHHMYAIPEQEILPLPREWLAGYEREGIDMTSIYGEPVFWWDREVLGWFEKYGTKTFQREAIWDVDWVALAKKINPEGPHGDYSDPRNRWDKYIHRWLRATQLTPSRQRYRIERILRYWGW